jgi:hypothetical protein
MQEKVYWGSEEFEELVAKGLIAMYETTISKQSKKCPNFARVNEKDFEKIKKRGCYFPSNDRIALLGEIDIKNDGVPDICFITSDAKSSAIEGEYLRHIYARKIPSLPRSFISHVNKYVYEIIYITFTFDGKTHFVKSFVTMDGDGKIYDPFVRGEYGKLVSFAWKNENGDSRDVDFLSLAIQLHSDKRFLWNVCANEGNAKATFGCYEEEVKSLFYARELPLTETGRKRPLLHWVNSHQRRIKSGIDIDIRKHLRGNEEFVFNGTKFTITNPLKEKKSDLSKKTA